MEIIKTKHLYPLSFGNQKNRSLGFNPAVFLKNSQDLFEVPYVGYLGK